MPGREIAVVVPTYRRLDRAVRMVDALERQTLERDRFEVIFVDDSSGDGTTEALSKRAASTALGIRVLSTDANRGPAAARNTGWRAAETEFVAFVDDDCVPDPGWLEAGLEALLEDREVGVVQGRTLRPPGAQLGDWALFREVRHPSPYFEGCNLFFRTEALAQGGGFDEQLGRAAEDTAAGWAVLDAGWYREFAEDAVVYHDVEHRSVAWHVHHGFRERANVIAVAARHPAFRREAFWRPWAFQRDDAVCTLAVAGLLLSLRWRPAALLALPYLRMRRPPAGHPRPIALLAQHFAVDVARAAGVSVGAMRNRVFVI